MLTLAINLEATVSVENNTYLSKGVLASSNAELVSKIVGIAKEIESEVATP